MALLKQTDRGIVIAYKAQSAIGTAETGSGGKKIRFGPSPGLVLEKASVPSTESRNDGLARAAGDGRKTVSGSFNGPAAVGAYDDLDAAVMRSTFTSADTIAESDVSSATLTLASNVGTLSTGSWTAAGLRVGMFGYFSSGEDVATASANRYCLVTACGTTTATFTPVNGTALTDEGPLSDWTFNVAKTCIQGTTDSEYTIEQYRDFIDKAEQFEWCRFGSHGWSLSPDQEIQRQFSALGRDMAILATSSSPGLTSPTVTTTEAMQSARAKLVIGSSQIVGLSQFSFTNNIQPFRDDTVDELTNDIGVGQPVITASVTILEDDLTRVQSFIDGDYQVMGIYYGDGGTAPEGFEGLSFTRAKFISATPSGLGADRFSSRTFNLAIDADLSGGAYDATMYRYSTSSS